MIIDLHAHCNSGSKYDCPETEIDKRSLEFLMKKHSSLNIGPVGISYYSSVLQTNDIYEENLSLSKQCKDNKQLFQLPLRQNHIFLL